MIRILISISSVLLLVTMHSCTQNEQEISFSGFPLDVETPVAEKRQHITVMHGDTLQDDYFWLRDDDRKNPDVIAYLEAENRYLDTMMSGTRQLQEQLFAEMKGRIKEKDESVPVFNQGYYYYSRTDEGKEYYKYCRRKGSMDAPEEILLDVDEMAKGFAYFSVGGISISDDQNWLVYGVDTVSRRQYTLYFKNLQSGEILAEKIVNTEGYAVWAADNQTIFYTVKNPKTLLSEKIFRHKMGTEPAKDLLVYQEKDPSNYIGITKTKSRRFIFIVSQATQSSEYLMIDAAKPESAFAVFQPRMKDVLYSITHAGNKFFIRTNRDAKNFKLMQCPEETTGVENWTDLVPHRNDVLLEDVDVFASHMVLTERSNGLLKLRVSAHDNSGSHYIDFGEPAYTVYPGNTPDYESKTLRYSYTSLTTPGSVYDYDMDNRKAKLMKQAEVLGGFDKNNYVTDRLFATAKDGTKVPISIVYHKTFKKDGNAPLLLYAYGSYGYSMDATFNSNRLSLLDRGFVYAIAHIRGGQEMGRQWYEDGRLLNKKNTFTDFIDCGEFLVKEKYTSYSRLYAQGGSAGGLLMGAVVNMRPDMWNGVIAQVPFVDVINTMLDESIPLTTNEFDEWGNPKNKEFYEYMISYSPYDNVEAKDYPNLLVTTGLHDSQVQYWEPAKWVAKLRTLKTDSNLLLLRTQMEQGHGGASGRFEYLKDIAIGYAFLLSLEANKN
jgi:oligopeptidase B